MTEHDNTMQVDSDIEDEWEEEVTMLPSHLRRKLEYSHSGSPNQHIVVELNGPLDNHIFENGKGEYRIVVCYAM